MNRNGQKYKTRVYSVVPGFSPKHNIGVYNNCVTAVETALVERYFLCKVGDEYLQPPRVPQTAYQCKQLRKFRTHVLTSMPHLPVLTYDQAIDLFPAKKRRVYQEAYESLTRSPVTEVDANLSTFVKFEKQDLTKAPRVINPRNARYNLELARYLKHTEHFFFDAINTAVGSATHL